MSLIKSILLGSAAGIVAVASAQAADLPTKKAAPVAQYVKICNVGGITGWTLPGSDTCVKLSGYITGQFVAGNLSNQYNWSGALTSAAAVAVNPFATAQANQQVLVQGGDRGNLPIYNAVTGKSLGVTLPNQQNAIFNRDATGWTTRANLAVDVASNTAYGPLLGHIEIREENGNGLDNTGTATGMNEAYLSWAGITAGKAASFFSFIGGGDNWANIFSPDRKGWNEPDLIAYTASFGGGFSATISAESTGANFNGPGTDLTGAANANSLITNPGNITFGGQRWPDIVGALHVTQGWGEAQLSGVIHNVNVKDYNYYGDAYAGPLGYTGNYNASENKTGWAIDAGLKINLPSFGAGDNLVVTGAFSRNATWYSGLPEGMWGDPENGQTNGNGQPMYLADAYFNATTNQWSVPTAWSVAAQFEHQFTSQFYVDLLGSVGQISWSNQNNYYWNGSQNVGTGEISPKATSWIIGADLGWVPVTNLNFDLELMYQSTTQTAPSGFQGTVLNNGVYVPGLWVGNSSGFAGRLRITRYF